MVGEGALIHELYKAGFTITDVNPDFVIVGETRSYNWDMMHKAAYFVANGARFIATNPDTHGRGFYPACGALCAGIEKSLAASHFMWANPARGLFARRSTKCRRIRKRPLLWATTCVPIFWRASGGSRNHLVLSGVSTLDDIDSMPFRPSWIYPSVAEIDVI